MFVQDENLTFPASLDSSAIASFMSCPTKFYWSKMRKRKPKSVNYHLTAGGAFARGLEIARKAYYVDGLKQDDALAVGLLALTEHYGDLEPPKKQWDRMAGALVAYVDTHPFETDSIQPLVTERGPAVEFSFALPLRINHPETGEPILYTGRCDMIGWQSGPAGNKLLWGVDEKTTTQLGEQWAYKWEMRGQFLGYTWALQENGYNVEGIFTRAVAIRKEGFDFAESPQRFPTWQVKRWHEQTHQTVERMIWCWKNKWYDQNFGDSCHGFSGCDFKKLCMSDKPELWLPVDYEEDTWSPIQVEPSE